MEELTHKEKTLDLVIKKYNQLSIQIKEKIFNKKEQE